MPNSNNDTHYPDSIKDIVDLKNKFSQQLPGLDAQMRLAPLLAGKPFRPINAPETAFRSGVLVPLYFDEQNNDLTLILTLRSSNLNSHKGQISFPGGRIETGENPVQASLREAHEEIGLEPAFVEVLGEMTSLYIPPSNSVISPVIGFLKKLPDFKINKAEVEEIILLPLEKLLLPGVFRWDKWNMDGKQIDVPYWEIHKTTPLWGATAMVISELLELLYPQNSFEASKPF